MKIVRSFTNAEKSSKITVHNYKNYKIISWHVGKAGQDHWVSYQPQWVQKNKRAILWGIFKRKRAFFSDIIGISNAYIILDRFLQIF